MPEDAGAPLPPETEDGLADSSGEEIDEERIARIVRAAAGAARRAEAEEGALILKEVEKLSSRKSGWLYNVVFLAVSVAVFAAVGKFAWGWEILVLIMIVVAVHEAGHFVGMKLFGYDDVSIFFIPLFGGAVSGRSGSVPAYKRALVALMGPVPGLVLGLVCALAYGATEIRFLFRLAQGFVLINAFNLLPFYPLDGGHLLNDVLFCRSRYLELGVRVLGGVLLALIGLLAGYTVLIVLGAVTLLFSGGSFKIAGLAERLRAGLSPELLCVPKLDPATAAPIIAEVRAAYPHLEQPQDLAFRVDEVWERLRTRPPGFMATLAILSFYGGLVFCVAAVFAWSWAARS